MARAVRTYAFVKMATGVLKILLSLSLPSVISARVHLGAAGRIFRRVQTRRIVSQNALMRASATVTAGSVSALTGTTAMRAIIRRVQMIVRGMGGASVCGKRLVLPTQCRLCATAQSMKDPRCKFFFFPSCGGGGLFTRKLFNNLSQKPSSPALSSPPTTTNP